MISKTKRPLKQVNSWQEWLEFSENIANWKILTWNLQTIYKYSRVST